MYNSSVEEQSDVDLPSLMLDMDLDNEDQEELLHVPHLRGNSTSLGNHYKFQQQRFKHSNILFLIT